MNNNSICQIFVVFGRNNVSFPNDGNIYINGNQFRDLQSLANILTTKYNEQVQNNRRTQINFLIPDERFRASAEHIIDEIAINGRRVNIQIVVQAPSQDLTQNVNQVRTQSTPSYQTTTNNVNTSPAQTATVSNNAYSQGSSMTPPNAGSRSNIQTPVTPVASSPVQSSQRVASAQAVVSNTVAASNAPKEEPVKSEEVASNYSYTYKPENNVYRGEVNNSNSDKKSIDDQIASSNGYNPNLISIGQDTLGTKKKKRVKKNSGFAYFPVIIFIISFLLLVASGILLFVID